MRYCVQQAKGKRDAEVIFYVIMTEFADRLTEQKLQWVLRR